MPNNEPRKGKEQIVLSQDDFKHLVAGGELITAGGNHIILADFGYQMMHEAVTSVETKRSAVQLNNVRMQTQ